MSLRNRSVAEKTFLSRNSTHMSISKSMRVAQGDNDLPVPEVELYHGTYTKINIQVVKVLFVVLLPFSWFINLMMPNLDKRRNSLRYLPWGLSLSALLLLVFSAAIVWLEDGLFIGRNYPGMLLGLTLNAPVVTLPHLMHNLAILNPNMP